MGGMGTSMATRMGHSMTRGSLILYVCFVVNALVIIHSEYHHCATIRSVDSVSVKILYDVDIHAYEVASMNRGRSNGTSFLSLDPFEGLLYILHMQLQI